MKHTIKTIAIKPVAVAEPQPDPDNSQLIELAPGDVVRGNENDYIMEAVNGTRARLHPLKPQLMKYAATDGSVIQYDISRTVLIDRTSNVKLVERRGENGLKEFFASKVSRRVVTTGTGGKRKTEMKSTKTIAGVTLPANPYDAAAWEEIHAGGTKDEIAKRIAARFKGDSKKHRADPANAMKYLDEKSDNNYQSEMKAAGLSVNIGKPFKAVKVDEPTAEAPKGAANPAPSVAAGAPGPKPATSGGKKGGGAAPVKSGGKAAAKGAAGKAPGKVTGGKETKPIQNPRGGLAAEALAEAGKHPFGAAAN